MIPIIIGLLLVCLGIHASIESSSKVEPTWTLLSTDGTDLCTDTVCKTTYGQGVIFQANWTFNGRATDPKLTFSDENDLIFSDNKTYYLIETTGDEDVWPGTYKFGTVPGNSVMFGGSYNLTTPPLLFHHHHSEEFQDNSYLGDLSLSFPYRKGGQDRILEWPKKTVIIEKHADNDQNDSECDNLSESNNEK